MKMTKETAVNAILTHINACYQDSTKPSTTALVELYAQVGEVLSQVEETSFHKEMAKIISKECPAVKGFSLRNLNRMTEFYTTFSVDADLLANALTIGWTQGIVIMESFASLEEMAFYVSMVEKQGLSKAELISELAGNAFETAKQMKLLEKVAELHETVPFAVAPVSLFTKGTTVDSQERIRGNVTPPVGKLKHFLQGSSPPRWKRNIPWKYFLELLTNHWCGKSPPRLLC